jgi:V/A-type H+-transporting ATPase subunit E
MKNETEKLNKFKLAVFAEVEQQAQSIVKEAQAQQKQLLSEAKEESQTELLTELEKIDKEFEAGKVRAVSSRKLESQRNVLTHRNEMIDKVFDNIRNSLAEFCNSEQYAELLKQRLELCAQQTGGKK